MTSAEERSSEVEDILAQAFELEAAGDLNGAITAFQAAAELGCADACSILGTIYDDVLIPAQPAEAARWYKQGVDAGDSSCAWNLAMHYCGLGDRDQYDRWLVTALEMGDPDAQSEMSEHHWWAKRNAAP